MFRKPQYLVFSLVFLLVLVLLNLPPRTTAQLKLALSSLFLPLFGLAGSAQQLAAQGGNAITPRRVLISEVDRLRLENQRLQIEAMQTAQLLTENNQLRQALGWQKQSPWKGKLARVLTRDPANWWRVIHVNLGSRDGVMTNLSVVTPDGLVGRVDQVDTRTCRVLLLGDPNCRVAAMIEKSRDSGVIFSTSASVFEQSLIEFNYLSRNSPIAPGQRVVTSGDGGIFPKGIYIGEIADFRSVGYGLYLEARVKLAVNLKQLEQVWIILP